MATIYRRGSVWWVRLHVGKKHIHRSSKSSRKADAEALVRELQAELSVPVPIPVPPDQRLAWSVAVERFFVETSVRPKTVLGYRTSERALAPLVGHLHLDQIDRRVIADVVSRRKATGISDTAVRRDLAFLSVLCAAAVRWDVLPTNPVAGYSKRHLRESPPRQRFLSRGEYRALLAAARTEIRPMIQLAVETGLRRAELFGLQWKRVDLPRRELILEVTKSGRPRRVPLSPAAHDLLHRLQRPGEIYVFAHPDGRPYEDVHRSFRSACERAGIENFRWHDLRHTYASWWVQDGGDIQHLARILGHSTTQMTQRYAHLRTDDLHRAVADIDRRRQATIEALPQPVAQVESNIHVLQPTFRNQ